MPYVGQTITDVFPTSINVDTATIATANISNQLTDANMSAGSAVQVVNVQSGAVATGTTAMPLDDTIPQITEGDEYMTLAITPTSASNKLRIEVLVNCASSTTTDTKIALFVGTTANALSVSDIFGTADWRKQPQINYYMTAGATSELTFRVRGGGSNGTFTFNGYGSARKFGGTFISSITITEIAV